MKVVYSEVKENKKDQNSSGCTCYNCNDNRSATATVRGTASAQM